MVRLYLQLHRPIVIVHFVDCLVHDVVALFCQVAVKMVTLRTLQEKVRRNWHMTTYLFIFPELFPSVLCFISFPKSFLILAHALAKYALANASPDFVSLLLSV